MRKAPNDITPVPGSLVGRADAGWAAAHVRPEAIRPIKLGISNRVPSHSYSEGVTGLGAVPPLLSYQPKSFLSDSISGARHFPFYQR
jgi:hypothetical protein